MPEAEVSHELQYIPLERLHFDPNNPRFPVTERGATREAALRWLLDAANLPDLMRSIAAQDYFPGEPLLVVRDGEDFLVVEGNRRFAACWLLSYPDDAPTKRRTVEAIAQEARHRPRELPALVFRSEEQILPFLGYRHITGIQEWSALAKARYLRRLWDAQDGPPDRVGRLRHIARQIGSRSDYVARLLTSLALYAVLERTDFYGIPGLNEGSISFSLLVLAMNRPHLVEFLGLKDGQDFDLAGLNEDRLEELARWFFEEDGQGRTTLGESRNVSLLVQVVQNEDALASLRAGSSLSTAYRLAMPGEVDLSASLREALVALQRVVTALDAGDSPSEEDSAVITELGSLWNLIASQTGAEL